MCLGELAVSADLFTRRGLVTLSCAPYSIGQEPRRLVRGSICETCKSYLTGLCYFDRQEQVMDGSGGVCGHASFRNGHALDLQRIASEMTVATSRSCLGELSLYSSLLRCWKGEGKEL